MGKVDLVTGLVKAILGKSTFLQVARTATKGNVVQKGLELSGKQAIKFFEKMPCDFQRYVQTVNAENLTVRYGVKGYKGSSVTGFQVLDGEKVVAKGAMGIDKTYGKKPILQMRVKLYQDSQNASFNFKYDGNRAFNGSAASGSTFKDGRFHMRSSYGDTVNFEYMETNNFSNWLQQNGWSRFDNIKLPTAKQFVEFRGQVDKGIKEFVSGRKTFTPEQRENMLMAKMSRQKDLVAKREYLKRHKTQIREQMQREIEALKGNPELKQVSEFHTKAKEYIKTKTIQKTEIKGEIKTLENAIKENEQKLEKLKNEFNGISKSELKAEYKQYQDLRRKICVEHNKLWSAGKSEEATAKLHEFNYRIGLPKRDLYDNLEREISFIKSNLVSQKSCRTSLLKEVETLTNQINKAKAKLSEIQEAEKVFRSHVAKQIKEVRAKYKVELDKYSPRVQKRIAKERRLAECAKKEEALKEQEAKRIAQEISGKKISTKSLKEQFKKENIQPYQNQEVVNQIKKIKGSTLEVAEQSRNIFLKEKGFNPELVKVRYATEAEVAFQEYGMAFEPLSGMLLVAPNYKANNLLTSSVIWHELDHFQLFADLCKSMGVNNFRKMMLKKYPQATAEMFNTEFWYKAIQNAKVLSPAEVTKYTKAFKEYKLPELLNDNVLTRIKYFGNPLETRAYDIQASIGKSLGLNAKDLTEATVMSRISRRMCAAIEKIEQNTGKVIDNDYLGRMMSAEILKVQGNEIDPINVLNNVLKNLESM